MPINKTCKVPDAAGIAKQGGVFNLVDKNGSPVDVVVKVQPLSSRVCFCVLQAAQALLVSPSHMLQQL